jgi:hypothetical protein
MSGLFPDIFKLNALINTLEVRVNYLERKTGIEWKPESHDPNPWWTPTNNNNQDPKTWTRIPTNPNPIPWWEIPNGQ